MCETCGGECDKCGEPSAYMLIVPRLSDEPFLACEEHLDEIETYLAVHLQRLAAAPWN